MREITTCTILKVTLTNILLVNKLSDIERDGKYGIISLKFEKQKEYSDLWYLRQSPNAVDEPHFFCNLYYDTSVV